MDQINTGESGAVADVTERYMQNSLNLNHSVKQEEI